MASSLYDDDDEDDSFYSAESIDLHKIDASTIELLHLNDTDFQTSDHVSDQEEEIKINPDEHHIKFLEDDVFYSMIRGSLETIKERSRESLETQDQDKSDPNVKRPTFLGIPKMPTSIRLSAIKRGFNKVKQKVEQKIPKNKKSTQCSDAEDPTTKEHSLSISDMESEDVEYLLWHRYSLWETKMAHYLVDKISSKAYHIFLFICVSIAIFIADIEHSIKYRAPMDIIVDDAILVIFSLLMFDIILCCLVYRNYPFSFFWFLETIGTLTLLLDVNSIYSEKDRYQQNLLLTGRAGRTIHAIRILALLRLSRIIQIIRISRLSKLANIIRIMRESLAVNPISENMIINPLNALMGDSDDDTDDNYRRVSTEIEHHTDRIASGVTVSVFEKIVVFIMILLCSMPLLSGVSSEQYKNIPLTKDVLINSIQNVNLKPYMTDIVNGLLISGKDIFYLEIDGKIYKDDRLRHKHLRAPEIFEEKGDYNLKILVDISEYTRFEHMMNIGFSILVILIFLIVIKSIIYAIDRVILDPLHALFKRIDNKLIHAPAKILQSNLIEPMINQVVGKTKNTLKDEVKNTMKRKLFNAVKQPVVTRLQQKSIFKQDETFKRLFSII